MRLAGPRLPVGGIAAVVSTRARRGDGHGPDLPRPAKWAGMVRREGH
jgi:hypothetical protein